MVRDYKKTEEFGMPKLPKLEGRVKITLHNCKNGKNEVIEGKNIVTNAVRDIFANNSMGGIDYSQMLDISSSFFGGLLVYQNPHSSLNADNYFIEDNPLTAHAGDAAPSSAAIVAEDYGRGSPINVVKTASSVTRTWEWGTDQGNGPIGALSLTHKDTGNAGLGIDSTEFRAFNPYLNVSNLSQLSVGGTPTNNNIYCKYDDRHGLLFLIGADGEFTPSNHKFSTDKITVYVVPLGYNSVGLNDLTGPAYDYVRKFTVTTSVTFYLMPSFFFDESTKYLWLFTNQTNTTNGFSQTTVYYTVIDCVNGTEIDHGTIVSDDSDIGMLCVGGQSSGGIAQERVNNIIKDGNYVYLPTGDAVTTGNVSNGISNFTGLKKIDITNQADQTLITNVDTQTERKSYMKNGGIIINGNRIFRGNTGYTCADGYFPNSQSTAYTWDVQEPKKPSSVFMPVRFYSSASNANRFLCVSKMLNTTLYNLPSVETKTATQSMTIEYTLQEV